MRKKLLLAAVTTVAATGTPAAEPEAWSLSGGLHYSSGDYGTAQTTTMWSFPISLRYDRDLWTFKFTVPFVRISGPASVVPGIGRLRDDASATDRRSAAGPGDIVASATYAAYYAPASRLGIDLTGKVKLGTADQNKGLGTGEDDFAVVVDVFKSLDRLVLLGSVGRHWLGSSPSIPLEDVWSLSVGASYRIGERDSAGVTYDYRQRSSPGGAPQREAIAFWARQLDRAWKGQAYLLKGFSDGSPDRGAGLSATYAF